MLTPDTALRPKSSSEALTEYLFIDSSENRFEINQRAYNDPAAFEKERELIFHKCWLYIGHQSEIPNNKDFVTRHVGGYNLIFKRDKKGKVHAFYNYCSHRGPCLAVEERGNKNVFSCPYHGWVYGSDGELRSTGSTGSYCDTINKDGRFNLRKVPRLDHYRGLYFVNYNPNAVDLETYLADTKEILDLMVDQFEEGLEVLQGEQPMFNGGNWFALFLEWEKFSGSPFLVNDVEVLDYTHGGGIATQRYIKGKFEIADDEALILETEAPKECRYWMFHLADVFLNAMNWLHNQVRINGHYAKLDSDGKFRAVISDPGVANWLDASGYQHGHIVGRWKECSSYPKPGVKKVKVADVRQHLPQRYQYGNARRA